MGILALFISILVVASLLPMAIKRLVRNKTTKPWIKKTIYFLAVFLFFVLLSEIIMNYYDYYYRGYKTRTFILIATCILFVISYIITNFKNKLYKVFIEIILFASVFITCFVGIINLVGYNSDLFFEDDKSRLETFKFINNPKGMLPTLYQKKGIIEEKIILEYTDDNYYNNENYVDKDLISDYKVLENDSLIEAIFYFEDGDSIKTQNKW